MNQIPSQGSTLQNKIVIVTGAGSGIGRASCIALADAGATVVAAGRTTSSLDATAELVSQRGGAALAYRVDVTSSSDVAAMIDFVEAEYHGIDAYFSNAGISPDGTTSSTTETDWDTCLATNLTSLFLAAKHAVPALERRGGGTILATVGTLGLRPTQNKAAYSAAKAGAISLIKSIALDFGHLDIRANAVCPGLVRTPLTSHMTGEEIAEYQRQYQPLPGTIEAEDIAAMVAFLVGSSARFITGQCFVVDGGQQAGLY